MKFLLIILLSYSFLFGNIDLNRAGTSELSMLPLSYQQVDDIINFIDRRGGINTIYELLDIYSISIEDIRNIKTLVVVHPYVKSDFVKEQNLSSYKIQQWLSAEGNMEGLSDVWLDRIFQPRDINTMNHDDLSALPNLSPIDVAAVLKQKSKGKIKGLFELRNSPGISYWGYKNLRDFVKFDTQGNQSSRIHGRYSQIIRTVPVTTNPDDEGTILAFKNSSRPEIFQKLSFQFGPNLESIDNAGGIGKGHYMKWGFSHHQNMGNPKDIFTRKVFASIENLDLGFVRIDRIIFGNFSASFGQSLVFESGDYFSPRRTGFGFTKRARGVFGDLTRSDQYILNGVASQFSNSFFRSAIFYSKAPRDAVVNRDSSFSTLIVMHPRLPLGANEDSLKIFSPLTSSVNEITWGWNLKIMPLAGTHFGITFYESLYDRVLDPQIIETITGGEDDNEPGLDLASGTNDYDEYSGDAFYLTYMSNSADPEINAMYSSSGKSPLWDRAKSFRRVVGFNYGIVFGNVSLQGEYG